MAATIEVAKGRKRVVLTMAVALMGRRGIENGKHVCGERQNALARLSTHGGKLWALIHI
jgi:hypothetical protein